jgi:hypothetical protein
MLNGVLHLSSSPIARALLLAALVFALLGAAPTTPQRTRDASVSQEELDALLAPPGGPPSMPGSQQLSTTVDGSPIWLNLLNAHQRRRR